MDSPNQHVSIGFLMNQTSRKIIHLLMHRFREYDVTPEQWSVLYQLHKGRGINQKELARRTAKDQPTTARILDLLIKKDLIQKQMSENDRRAFIVSLSDKGREITEQIAPIEESTMNEVVAGLEPKQIEQIKQWLHQMNENIDAAMNSKE
ncbi:MarR family transcriptional regulator [Fictibacillus enclensis]|uniref:Transcriptional regulator n=1 Tax=Fictibacillus enclensis TaxID=1017270 RepID=A0A0V8J9F2_9BACL|nr:MarR family transcriptional regulator [Fictibacillus enclensis]KSU83280.1 transcriptional regulator [Fictibacillus enclensis]MDM5339854.1 MarR family transcriptional regulator [Fictibacillus enclensis]WHY71392.1 MarR family transcriptional regulator [Fictibacillus enclensis]SCC12894.1 DNA-binding transcriptional regulator, MarR family [Fictibacillus enclensis]